MKDENELNDTLAPVGSTKREQVAQRACTILKGGMYYEGNIQNTIYRDIVKEDEGVDRDSLKKGVDLTITEPQWNKLRILEDEHKAHISWKRPI